MKKLLMTISLGLLLSPAMAQDKPSREREQLRRAQAALQAAQAQLEGLQSEKAGLLREKIGLAEALQRQRAGLRGLQDKASGELHSLRQEMAAANARQLQADTQAAEREAQLQQQLAQSRRELSELRQSNTSLAVLLASKTKSLADADEKNRALHGLALDAVDRWVNKTQLETSLQSEPLFGLAQVRTQDSAEALRLRIDAQRTLPLQ